jgi:DNA-binding GntR family transcriptional regulator
MIVSASALEKLRDAILRLELSPGAVLTERGLEPMLETSRTTVRSALLKLEAEGLVVKDGRGYIVAPIDLKDITQACDWREIIETNAAKLAIQKASETQLESVKAQLETANPAQPLERYLRDATDFHVTLAQLGGNAFMVRALEDVLTRLSRARSFEAGTEAGRTRANAEHKRILETIAARDADAAERELKAHLARSRDRLLGALMESGGLQVRGTRR